MRIKVTLSPVKSLGSLPSNKILPVLDSCGNPYHITTLIGGILKLQ
jgi:hypothetical protein